VGEGLRFIAVHCIFSFFHFISFISFRFFPFLSMFFLFWFFLLLFCFNIFFDSLSRFKKVPSHFSLFSRGLHVLLLNSSLVVGESNDVAWGIFCTQAGRGGDKPQTVSANFV
jgi:hypothetical protein